MLNKKHDAAGILLELEGIEVIKSSILDFLSRKKIKWDFVYTSGVLIHIVLDYLRKIYDIMSESSLRYVCMIEYYKPVPVSVPYRNNTEKLFKRDFCDEFLTTHPEFILREYGFVYHNDNIFPGGDDTWFLMERVGNMGC